MSHYEKITGFFDTHRRMPSYAEIAKLMKYKSKSSAHYLVSKLIDEGYLSKDKTGKLIPKTLSTEIQLVGTVPAGGFGPSQEDVANTITLVEHLVPHKESTYALIVDGDSMQDAGILSGDVVLFERTTDYKPGDIVIIQSPEGYTMKYFRIKHGTPYLEPANKKYTPLYPEEGEIIGVVTAQFRKYKQ